MADRWLPFLPPNDESEGLMLTPNQGRERGQKRAERGIKEASYLQEPQIRRDTLQMLDALLASPTGCATTDDAVVNLKAKHDDGGRWRASIPKRLLAEGLIVAERVIKSARPARHAGYLTEWRLIDRIGAETKRAAIAAEIEINKQSNGVEHYGQAI